MKQKNMDMFSENPKSIGQALINCWLLETDNPIPLTNYLQYQYKERYKALCIRCKVEPSPMYKWLLRPISSL
jgi:hypothetical protein